MRIIAIFILFFIPFFIFTEKLNFKIDVGSKYKSEARIDGEYYINNILFTYYSQRYKTISQIKEKDFQLGKINDKNYYYQLFNGKNYSYKEIEKVLEVDYALDPSGLVFIQPGYALPTMRNAPFFPDQDLKVGDQWQKKATEVQDFFKDNILSHIPVDIKYEIKDIYQSGDIKIALIQYDYQFNFINQTKSIIHPKIQQLAGISSTKLYFDITNGWRIKEEYQRNYSFLITDQTTDLEQMHQMIDSGTRKWTVIERMKKEEVEKELKKQLEEEKIEEVEVEQDEQGVKITLENIQFEAESAFLRDSEKSRLNKIAEILKKYKEKEILVKGHTTDKGTPEGRKKLSQQRAQVVSEYLFDKKAIDPDKTSFYGVGDSEPIADNRTEAGMKKNRRVEIYILEE
ncbi:MAG: OmpA family protein [Spirochaetes bacterium]|nr:OmpA family protein [Spirochaetota bacterium]